MNQNYFEKFGIKDVADVTIYRIEKKEEAYESQRHINVSSVLRGAVELRTVYPMEDGLSIDEGFEAYVFTDADILTHTNYDCDDKLTANAVYSGVEKFTFEGVGKGQEEEAFKGTIESGIENIDFELTFDDGENKLKEQLEKELKIGDSLDPTATVDEYSEQLTVRDIVTKRLLDIGNLEDYELDSEFEVKSKPELKITYTIEKAGEGEDNSNGYNLHFTVKFVAHFNNVIYKSIDEDELVSGVYKPGHYGKADSDKEIGTHEYSYAEQAFMLFAKRQNLLSKTGTRYHFDNVDELMGNLVFEDTYATSANSNERVVVLGLAENADENASMTGTSSWFEQDYDISLINEEIANLKETFTAKAYDIDYGTYAELVVEDEMGYYNPKFLGTKYDKAKKVIANTGKDEYEKFAKERKGIDMALVRATMWGEGEHYSINDAIDALRQQQKIIDADDTSKDSGISKLYGGYKVTGQELPNVGEEDTGSDYIYTVGETSTDITSKYNLDSVLEALTNLALVDDYLGKEVEVDYGVKSDDSVETSGKASNRAIYVDTVNAAAAASSHLYLLHNRNYRKLSTDTDGIFTFSDKKGNKVYYQDKIFAGVEWLGLVIIGNKGLMFVVNRHGENAGSRIGWLVSNSGFINDKEADIITKKGLIHTTDVTVNDETFEATCVVKSLKVRKIMKTTNRYTPVLFLDTLKISTLEQTAEEVYATGGHGNSNLIGWDYGREITLTMQDALFTPASMSAAFGGYDGKDFRSGIKETKIIDRTEPCIAPRSFIVPAGNQNGTPTEADKTPCAVYIDRNTMQPYPDGTPIAEGESYLKFTRSVGYEGQSLGKTIEISADKFPGTYKVVGDTVIRMKDTGEEQKFQFIIPMAKMSTEQTITLEADGDPSVFDMNMTVLRPEDGVMIRFVQYDVIENTEENDGSKMVKGTENLNLVEDAELYKVDTVPDDNESYIGATEY